MRTVVKVATCGCGEPITRPNPLNPGEWLHTDGRTGCVDSLTREPTGADAWPRKESPRLDPTILSRSLRRAGVRR
ncbi:hypothetical protein GCM10011608_09190 [Micromonospora sonchi]|uniref:Uncharacterized protein n=1 Tax=Micromonospora sonchi TaxID=1763543 RepID=A0A917TL75_9ACTN|nr:hypothetical protein GCM10011608_09190 [Micromonospora sonchi]